MLKIIFSFRKILIFKDYYIFFLIDLFVDKLLDICFFYDVGLIFWDKIYFINL